MKLIQIFIALLLVSCSISKTPNDILGDEKAEAFNAFLNSFDSFIESNYPNSTDVRIAYVNFMNDYTEFILSEREIEQFIPSNKWKIDESKILSVCNLMESTRMRHEIKLHSYDIYPPIYTEVDRKRNEQIKYDYVNEIDSIKQAQSDSLPFLNLDGMYLPMLLEMFPNDKQIKLYVDVSLKGDKIDPIYTAKAFPEVIENNNWPDNNALRIVLAVDFYYEIIEYISQ